MAKVADLYVDIGAKTDKLQKASGDINNIFRKMAGYAAAAFSISKISAFIGESAKLAAQAEGVYAAFLNLNQPDLLDNLQKATSNTVSNLDLMKIAVRASNFNIPLTQMASLLQFATKRAQETGQSVDLLVEKIILGIGRKSVLVLDDLGLSAERIRGQLKGVGMETATVGDIAAAVGNIAQEEMAKSGDVIETTAIKTAQLKAEWTNLKTAVGEATNVLVQKTMPVLEGLVSELSKGANVLSTQQIPLWRKLLGLISPEMKRANRLQADFIDALTEQAQKTNAVTKATSEGNDEVKQTVGLIGKLKEEQEKLEESLPSILDKSKLAEANDRIKEIKAEIEELMSLTNARKGEMEGGFIESILGNVTTSKDTDFGDWYAERARKITESNKWIERSMELTAWAANSLANELVHVGDNVDSMEDFARAVVNASRKAIAAIIAETVAFQIERAMRDSKNPWLGIILGAAAGGATAAVFNSLVPSFAEGGIVQGKQLALVGDNPSGTEAIIPKEKWGQLGGTVRIEGVVRGKDLYWVMANYQDFLNRTT